MVLQFGAPDRNWQFTQRWFTTRPLLIATFYTCANLSKIGIGINRAMNSFRIHTKAAHNRPSSLISLLQVPVNSNMMMQNLVEKVRTGFHC